MVLELVLLGKYEALFTHRGTKSNYCIWFDMRPAGIYCPSISKIQSYCGYDASDPYCCATVMMQRLFDYEVEYGNHALAFAKNKLG